MQERNPNLIRATLSRKADQSFPAEVNSLELLSVHNFWKSSAYWFCGEIAFDNSVTLRDVPYELHSLSKPIRRPNMLPRMRREKQILIQCPQVLWIRSR